MSYSFTDIDREIDEIGLAPTVEEMKAELKSLAEDIVASINQKDSVNSQELLSVFVSELFLSATKQSIRADRRKKQAEGIAKAKARGVKFGTRQTPLPDNFDEVRRSWRNREINLKDAAKLCGMPTTTFYDAVRRAESSAADT